MVLPEIGEPLDKLGCIILVEFNIGEVHLENGAARISDPEEHQFCFAQMHRSQRGAVDLDSQGKIMC